MRVLDQGSWTGGICSKSGQVLTALLSKAAPQLVVGKKVVELGCGCGVVGLCAGARLVTTQLDDNGDEVSPDIPFMREFCITSFAR